MYRIISFDGGGIKGAITARLLERINAEVPGFPQRANLYAGTSTGSILAITIANGHTPTELVKLYYEQGQEIFKQTIWHKIHAMFGLICAKYDTEHRKSTILPYVNEKTLNDLLPANILAVSYQLDSTNDSLRKWKTKVFHNFPGADSDGEEKAIDVILRSSAAPVYFPTYQGFIDGAVVANNPSMCALAESLNNAKGGQCLDNIKLLSFGTGTSSSYLNIKNANWGLGQWATNLISLMIDADADLPAYQCEHILKNNYHRLQPILDKPYGIDSWKEIQSMINLADNIDITSTIEWIKENW